MKPNDMFFRSNRVEDLYERIVGDEDARVCTDIDEQACREVPGNFFLQVITHFLTKLGDAIANPKTVLAWLLSALGSPGAFTAFLVPVRESGSLIPQLVIASYVRRQAIRKWTYVIGCLLQAASILWMAGVALTLEGIAAGFGLLGALVVFSLARGLCSVAAKDVLGKTIPKTRRGRVNGWSASIAGIVTIGIGISLLLGMGTPDGVFIYAILLVGAAGLWILAAGGYSLIREFPGESEGGGNALEAALKRLHILVYDHTFRQFVLARSFLLCSALSAPFLIMLAHEQTDGKLLVLGLFVIADGLANVVSSPIWGRYADRSSRRVMIFAGVGAAFTGILLVLTVTGIPSLAGSHWIYPLFFFLLAIAHAGVRLGRKTYIVDAAQGNKRTDYVAVSNSIIGIVLLVVGAIGAVVAIVPVQVVILILAAMGLTGAVMSSRLPEAS